VIKNVHIGFFFLLFIFLLHQLTQKVFELSMPFIDAYLDPFCFIGLTLYLIKFERKLLLGTNHLSLIEAILYAIFLALISELILPLFSEKLTYDLLDFFAMFAGLSFFLLINFSQLASFEVKRH